jgi:hypothetical protein
MTRRLNFFLLGVLLIVGLPYYWLLLETGPGDARPHDVSIGDLRRLSAEKPGPLPSAIEAELVGHRLLPGNLVAAGSGIKRRFVGLMVVHLQVPGGKPVIIEPGRASGRDDGLLAVHLHYDGPRKLAAARQSAGLVIDLDAGPADGKPAAIAPGIVVIPAPSRRPGTRMLYVRTASGAEYLFAGDVAPLALSWLELRNRPRLLTDYWFPEDRRRVFEWLLTIRKLKAQAPALHVIPGYDFEWLGVPESQSGITVRLP